MRIVSLDFCADQYVIKLADPEQILAVSPNAVSHYSVMRNEAQGVPTVRPIAEDVLILKPDLVVRSFGGGPNAATFFERAGIPVLQVGWASKIDGEGVGSIPFLIQDMADGLGQSQRGEEIIAEFRARLGAIQARRDGESILYITPSGFTTGAGSLVHEAIVAAGLDNFQTGAGWRSLPLERLVFEQPDRVATAYFESEVSHSHSWSSARHPIARAQIDKPDAVRLEGAWSACGGWSLLNAVEALAAPQKQ